MRELKNDKTLLTQAGVQGEKGTDYILKVENRTGEDSENREGEINYEAFKSMLPFFVKARNCIS